MQSHAGDIAGDIAGDVRTPIHVRVLRSLWLPQVGPTAMTEALVVGIWVPFGWWRVLAVGGAILSLFLMAASFGATKVLPMTLDLVVLWVAITNWSPTTPIQAC